MKSIYILFSLQCVRSFIFFIHLLSWPNPGSGLWVCLLHRYLNGMQQQGGDRERDAENGTFMLYCIWYLRNWLHYAVYMIYRKIGIHKFNSKWFSEPHYYVVWVCKKLIHISSTRINFNMKRVKCKLIHI